MKRKQLPNRVSDRDRLIIRPDVPLPTPLDPASPEARGYPNDPKVVPATGQGDPDGKPSPRDVDRSA